MTVAALASGEGATTAITKSANATLKFGTAQNAPTLAGVARVSSIIVASESPFVVEVKNAAGTYTTYKIPGQKPTKISCSRETSMIGSAALFRSANYGTGADAIMCRICDNGNVVDVNVNAVVDGSLDD